MYSDGVWSRSIRISEVLLYTYCKKECLLFKKLFWNIWHRPIHQ